jgi:hypothetical protein
MSAPRFELKESSLPTELSNTVTVIIVCPVVKPSGKKTNKKIA